jgi:thiamine pyrophosphate-dependent acetolactate synthase large subunit-like protein
MTGLTLGSALAALRAARNANDVVITTMGAAREWMAAGPIGPLDFVYVPSSMSQASSVGLGLAIARPDRRIVVVNGDGSMLMNLGSLVTIAARAPRNLVVIVCVNGVYEVTGGQPIPGAGTVDFGLLARASGFPSTERFTELEAWTEALPEILTAPGPRLVELVVPPVKGIGGPRSPGPAAARAERFRQALGQLNDPGPPRPPSGTTG